VPEYAQPPQAPEEKEAEVSPSEIPVPAGNPINETSASEDAAETPASEDSAEAPVPAGMAPAYGQAPPPQGDAPPQQGAPAYAQPPGQAAPAAPAPAPIIINIQQNAGGFNWAPPPNQAAVAQANCPPGMEYFLGINSITVHQKISCSENCSSLCCPCITPCVHEGNEYTVS
jgi:hypothetical protein